jgi:plastocyanin
MKQLTLFLAALSIIFQAYAARAQQSTPAPPSDVQKVEVVDDTKTITPDIIKIKAGKPVELTLRSVTSLIPHNFTIDDPASGLSVDADILSGEDVTVTFTPLKTGKFQFYCGKKSILGSHLKKGMKGTLVVE